MLTLRLSGSGTVTGHEQIRSSRAPLDFNPQENDGGFNQGSGDLQPVSQPEPEVIDLGGPSGPDRLLEGLPGPPGAGQTSTMHPPKIGQTAFRYPVPSKESQCFLGQVFLLKAWGTEAKKTHVQDKSGCLALPPLAARPTKTLSSWNCVVFCPRCPRPPKNHLAKNPHRDPFDPGLHPKVPQDIVKSPKK